METDENTEFTESNNNFVMSSNDNTFNVFLGTAWGRKHLLSMRCAEKVGTNGIARYFNAHCITTSGVYSQKNLTVQSFLMPRPEDIRTQETHMLHILTEAIVDIERLCETEQITLPAEKKALEETRNYDLDLLAEIVEKDFYGVPNISESICERLKYTDDNWPPPDNNGIFSSTSGYKRIKKALKKQKKDAFEEPPHEIWFHYVCAPADKITSSNIEKAQKAAQKAIEKALRSSGSEVIDLLQVSSSNSSEEK